MRRVLAGFVVLATPIAVWAMLASPAVRLYAPKCLFHEATGLYCPGCGGTRAVIALTHGRLAEAFHDNLLWPFTLPLIAMLWLSGALYAFRGQGLRMDIKNPKLAIAVASIIIGYGIVRNIPLYPFTLLAPLPH